MATGTVKPTVQPVSAIALQKQVDELGLANAQLTEEVENLNKLMKEAAMKPSKGDKNLNSLGKIKKATRAEHYKNSQLIDWLIMDSDTEAKAYDMAAQQFKQGENLRNAIQQIKNNKRLAKEAKIARAEREKEAAEKAKQETELVKDASPKVESKEITKE
jgi:hypothetical protein